MDSGYHLAMKVQDWERDIINRQRNIVFPDTMLNDVRFYRHIIRYRIKLNPVQRAGVLILAIGAMLAGFCILTYSIAAARDAGEWLTGMMSFAFSLPTFLFGLALANRGLTAASAPRPPRWWLRQRSRRP